MDTYCYGPTEPASPACKMELTFSTQIKPVIGGGTDYNYLANRPMINGVVLEGDKTNEQLKIDAISNEDIEKLLK